MYQFGKEEHLHRSRVASPRCWRSPHLFRSPFKSMLFSTCKFCTCFVIFIHKYLIYWAIISGVAVLISFSLCLQKEYNLFCIFILHPMTWLNSLISSRSSFVWNHWDFLDRQPCHLQIRTGLFLLFQFLRLLLPFCTGWNTGGSWPPDLVSTLGDCSLFHQVQWVLAEGFLESFLSDSGSFPLPSCVCFFSFFWVFIRSVEC